MKNNLLLVCLLILSASCYGNNDPKFVYVQDGCLHEPDGTVLSVWGVNLQPCLSWERKSFQSVGIPLEAEAMKKVTTDALNELEFMNCKVIRCHLTPADFTDENGNLVETIYLDLLDFMIAEAAKRGMYLYITFINHMNNAYVERSFMNLKMDKHDYRPRWILDEKMRIAARNYVKQLLTRKNPYSELYYKDDPSIAIWEMINEPIHYDYDEIKESPYYDNLKSWLKKHALNDSENSYLKYRKELVLNYINDMYAVIRCSGARQPISWSCNWHRMKEGHEDVFQATAESRVEVVSFCNYPGQSVARAYGGTPYAKPLDLTEYDYTSFFTNGYTNESWYGWALTPGFMKKAKIVYEYEGFYNQSSYIYPLQANFMRALGVQATAMWRYNFPAYAHTHSGSHFLNLKCTPRKAVSFAIAGEILKEMPLYHPFDVNNINEQVTDKFMYSYSKDLSIFSGNGKYYYSGDVSDEELPKPPATVNEIFGYGSSPLVSYDGKGIYKIKISGDEIQITIQPDATWVKEPWQKYDRGTLITRLDYEVSHTFSLNLEGWSGQNSKVVRVDDGNTVELTLAGDKLEFEAQPGRYVISR